MAAPLPQSMGLSMRNISNLRGAALFLGNTNVQPSGSKFAHWTPHLSWTNCWNVLQPFFRSIASAPQQYSTDFVMTSWMHSRSTRLGTTLDRKRAARIGMCFSNVSELLPISQRRSKGDDGACGMDATMPVGSRQALARLLEG